MTKFSIKDCLLQRPYETTCSPIKIGTVKKLRLASADEIKPTSFWDEDRMMETKVEVDISPGFFDDFFQKRKLRFIHFDHHLASDVLIPIFIDVENKLIVESPRNNVYRITAIRGRTTGKDILAALSTMASEFPAFWRELEGISIRLLYKKMGRKKKKRFKRHFTKRTLNTVLMNLLFNQFKLIDCDRYWKIKSALTSTKCKQLKPRECTRWIKRMKELDSLENEEIRREDIINKLENNLEYHIVEGQGHTGVKIYNRVYMRGMNYGNG